MKRIKHLKNKVLFTVTLICVLLIMWIFKIPCPYKYWLGRECLGCGMSRAYFSLLRFDFAAAFLYHPMFWSVPIAYVYFLFDGKVFGKKYLDYTVIILIVLGFFINWIAKIW